MKKISDGLYQVGQKYHAFIVDGDDGVTLIDSGLTGQTEPIVDGLSAIGRTVLDIQHIVLTHAHRDHCGGAATLKAASHCDVMCSHTDAAAVEGTAPYPFPPVMDRFKFLRPLSKLMGHTDPVEIDQLVSAGETLSLAGDLTAIATPGHTDGHLSFLLNRSGGVMLVGDAASANKKGEVVRGWFNAPTKEIDDSIRVLSRREFKIAVFGHAAAITEAGTSAFRAFAAGL